MKSTIISIATAAIIAGCYSHTVNTRENDAAHSPVEGGNLFNYCKGQLIVPIGLEKDCSWDLSKLVGVEAFPIAAGGIIGREGGITIVIAGNLVQVEKAQAVAKVRGEKSFFNNLF